MFYFSENYEYLKSLLITLVPAECSSTINNWAHQGQLLWEYMEITSEIQTLLKSAPDYHGITYQLEALKPRLTNLCQKIDQFPCPTAKHRCVNTYHFKSLFSQFILMQFLIFLDYVRPKLQKGLYIWLGIYCYCRKMKRDLLQSY